MIAAHRLLANSMLAAAIAMALISPVQAQEDEGAAPDHGAARISLVEGNVSVAHDSGETTGAVMNAPLVTGDRIITGENSRAEVQFDANSLIRLGPGTEVRMGDLEFRHYLAQIAQGTVMFRALRDPDAQIEISTPSVSLRPLRQGIYRVAVFGTTEITVRAGEAQVFSPGGSESLREGQTMLSRGPANDPEIMTEAAIPADDFDRWNTDRDRVFQRSDPASRYVSPDVGGTEALDGNGRWIADPENGMGWVPNEPPDWAPYQQGQWSWVDYYGWTWISYDPWGWAPYHYGRWFHGGYGWTWFPGPIVPRFYWHPALVGFFGWGAPGFGVSLGFGFGNVGWVPLAPREAFHPWYGRAAFGVNTVNVASAYRNARFANAVTSLHATDFGRLGVHGSSFARPSSGDLAHAGMMEGRMPFSATRESRQFSDRPAGAQAMPHSNGNTRFFSSPQARSGGVSPQGSAQAGVQANSGGWRRLDSSGARSSISPGAAGFTRSPAGAAGFTRMQSAPPARGFEGAVSPRTQQAVQIRPPIVTNRSAGQAGGSFGSPRTYEAPRSNYSGGFGGPRPTYAGGSSAPRPSSNAGGGHPSGGGGGHSSGGGHASGSHH